MNILFHFICSISLTSLSIDAICQYLLKAGMLIQYFNKTFYLQATKAILEKEAIGITIAMITQSLQVTKLAMLSRYS